MSYSEARRAAAAVGADPDPVTALDLSQGNEVRVTSTGRVLRDDESGVCGETAAVTKDLFGKVQVEGDGLFGGGWTDELFGK